SSAPLSTSPISNTDTYRILVEITSLGLYFTSIRSAHDALTHPGIIKAARKLNLDLMRKGPALNWKSHCPDLVAHALSI
ncbi:hypothetical protein ACLQ25_31740, partial [Micromonospora sp. DT44]|uniref:hypothetical protein n=1 Tax=Micromonospora sp. DT44 TaxID=3393439 RepID=UPI003CED3582